MAGGKVQRRNRSRREWRKTLVSGILSLLTERGGIVGAFYHRRATPIHTACMAATMAKKMVLARVGLKPGS